MNYFAYLLFGPWLGKISLLLLFISIILLLKTCLIQPIHGYKIRKILGSLLFCIALACGTYSLIQGNKPITQQHIKELEFAIKKTKSGNNIFNNYNKDWSELNEIDHITLKKILERKRHPHFKHKANSATNS